MGLLVPLILIKLSKSCGGVRIEPEPPEQGDHTITVDTVDTKEGFVEGGEAFLRKTGIQICRQPIDAVREFQLFCGESLERMRCVSIGETDNRCPQRMDKEGCDASKCGILRKGGLKDLALG